MSIDEKPQKGVTRRTFIKGAVLGAAGVAAGGMLAGCGGNEENKEPSSQVSNGTSEPSFLTPPDPIPEGEIKEAVEADVVVVGAGLSGCCVALSAADDGAKVVLLEKTDNVNFRGIDYGAIDSEMQKSIGNEVDKMDAVQEIMRYNAYKGDQREISLWVDNSGKVADWIMDKAEAVGCKPVAVPIAETTTPGAKLEIHGTLSFRIEPNEEALTYVPKGSDPYLAGLVYTFKKNVENSSAIDLRYKTPAVQLVRDDNGRVTGVIAGEEGSYTKFIGKKVWFSVPEITAETLKC